MAVTPVSATTKHIMVQDKTGKSAAKLADIIEQCGDLIGQQVKQCFRWWEDPGVSEVTTI
jgi:hypothetical protein